MAWKSWWKAAFIFAAAVLLAGNFTCRFRSNPAGGAAF